MKTRFTTGQNIVLALLSLFILTGLLADFIANDKAILCKDDSGIHFPIFSKQTFSDCSFTIYPPIRYKFNNIDEANANFSAPFNKKNISSVQQKHFLGTDQLGRDVASGMVHGIKIALLTGTLSMIIALIIGLIFGLFGAYYGNNSLKIRRTTLLSIAFIFFAVIYFFSYIELFIHSFPNFMFFVLGILIILILIQKVLGLIPKLSDKTILPLDMIISSFIEIFQSLPGSFLILILVSLFTKASIYNVILVIGLLKWPMIARYVRAEMLKIKAQRYIEASKAIGLTDWGIIWKHAMPATLTPVIVAVSFGFASAILLESALSFLGIGLPADHVSLGSLLSETRKNYEAWWLAVFPGIAIFGIVFIFNYMGDMLSKKISRK